MTMIEPENIFTGKPLIKVNNNFNNLTLKDLRTFIKECDNIKLPDNTKLLINNEDDITSTPVIEIIGDEDSIVFYNY